MANPNILAGRGRIKLNGAFVDTGSGTITLDPGGESRESVPGDYTAGAFKSGETKPAKLSFDALTKYAFDPISFGKLSDVTATVEFDNGQHFVIRHAWAEATPEIGTSGKASCVLMGPPAERTS